MKTLLPAPFLAGTAVLVCCLALTACSTPKGNPFPAGQGLAEVHRFFLADRLYLLPAPHARLYVEVDAVEGCVPSGATLDKLRSFLGAYCNKPGGIEIARSDVIPLKAARGISPSALARRYLDGPPENPAAASPAFIYVLFYNDALCDQVPAAASGPQAKGAKPRPRARNRNPHVEIGPYPAMIYLNTRPPIGFKWEQKWNLLHEAGHVLGLAFRPVGASAGHCLNRACLMSGAGRYRYLGLQRRLCEQCVAQLAEASRQSPSTNQRFVGPVLVRSEAGYHVLSLPHREKVIVGELAENDCREFAAAVRAATPAPGGDENDWRSECWLKEEASHEPAALRDILKRAIGFEEQALRTGKPSEPEQKEMRDRILLFKQSQPFREKR